MKMDLSRRVPVAVAMGLALAMLALGFLAALGVRSLVVGTASASPQVPNPGHGYGQIELPAGTWTDLDADLLDGLESTAFSTGPHTTSLPWSAITTKPAGFADDIDDDMLGGLSCANGEIAKWDGSAWQCGADVDTDTQLSEGQVESYVTNGPLDLDAATTLGGASISTGPHTTSLPWSTITSKPAGFADDIDDDMLGGLSCANGEIAKWDGSAWQCAADESGGGGAYWSLTGNSGTTPGTNFVGTTDNQALELHVNGARALRLEPDATSPNVIGGYSGNSVTSGVYGGAIGGGGYSAWTNRVTGTYGTVAGGVGNRAGGVGNTAATVGGGAGNDASRDTATVGGGQWNRASGDHATVGGGYSNDASGDDATVGGGAGNDASHYNATVGGGFSNTASGPSSTVGGGYSNDASSDYATVGGGVWNIASGKWATVGGGDSNMASGPSSTVGGGYSNDASDYFATVGGGRDNSAAGKYSFAAGRRAKIDALHDGSFLFADQNDFDFNSAAANEFAVRSTGGARFVSAIDGSGNPTAGVSLASGGTSWSVISDPNVKANFASVDGRDILERLASIPVETWNLKSQDASIRHIGPMAQDFYTAFAVGEDDRHITTVDADGVALAAIQGLYELSQEKDAEIADLKARVSALEDGTGLGSTVSQASSSSLPTIWLVLGGGLVAVLGLVLVQRRLAGGRR